MMGKKEHTGKCYKHTQSATPAPGYSCTDEPAFFLAVEKCFTSSYEILIGKKLPGIISSVWTTSLG